MCGFAASAFVGSRFELRVCRNAPFFFVGDRVGVCQFLAGGKFEQVGFLARRGFGDHAKRNEPLDLAFDLSEAQAGFAR